MFGISSFAQMPVLTVEIPNAKEVKGEIQISVFNDPNSFLKEGKEFKIYRFKVTNLIDKYEINGLPRGNYALIVYHDKNNNQKMDRSFLGIPQEAYGFSKNFKPKLSGPDFKDCSIQLTQDRLITIELLN